MQASLRNKVLEAKGIYKKFDNRYALQNINLVVYENEIFGLIGPDGAGKTTLLRIFATAFLPDQGKINILGCDILQNPESIKDKIGVVPQNFTLYNDLTVEENLNFFSKMYLLKNRDYARTRTTLLDIANLKPFLKRRAEHLSGGMQKKLALVCAMLHRPKLFLLDEPTTGIDPISRRELWDFFYELVKSGATIIISTPYIDEMERCTRVGFLYQGRLVIVDEPDIILNRYHGKKFDEIFINLIRDEKGD